MDLAASIDFVFRNYMKSPNILLESLWESAEKQHKATKNNTEHQTVEKSLRFLSSFGTGAWLWVWIFVSSVQVPRSGAFAVRGGRGGEAAKCQA